MNETIVITGDKVEGARFLTLKSGLSLELKGLRRSRGRSCYSILKTDYGYKGSKQSVYEQVCKDAEEMLGRA